MPEENYNQQSSYFQTKVRISPFLLTTSSDANGLALPMVMLAYQTQVSTVFLIKWQPF